MVNSIRKYNTVPAAFYTGVLYIDQSLYCSQTVLSCAYSVKCAKYISPDELKTDTIFW